MKKQLKDLNLEIPQIDLLESRKLFGGNGGYGEPPVDDPYDYDFDNPLRPGGVFHPIELSPVDVWGDHRSDDDNGRHDIDDETDDDRDRDEDRDEDRDKEQDEEEQRNDESNNQHDIDKEQDDPENPHPQGNPGNNGAEDIRDGGIGNPHNLDGHFWMAIPQDKSNCWLWAINETLDYFNALKDKYSVYAKETKDYLIGTGLFTDKSVNEDVSTGEVFIAITQFFESHLLFTNGIGNSKDIVNALNNNNPVIASVILNHNDAGHAVVIVGHDGEGNFKIFDPAKGTTFMSNDVEIYPKGITILDADEIIDLNPKYREYIEPKTGGDWSVADMG